MCCQRDLVYSPDVIFGHAAGLLVIDPFNEIDEHRSGRRQTRDRLLAFFGRYQRDSGRSHIFRDAERACQTKPIVAVSIRGLRTEVVHPKNCETSVIEPEDRSAYVLLIAQLREPDAVLPACGI